MVVYDQIEKDLISLGDKSVFDNEPNKSITKIIYDNAKLSVTLKDKYVTINRIDRNPYNNDKHQIVIKSKEYANLINSIVDTLNTKFELNIASPVVDGKIWLNIDRYAKIENAKNRRESLKLGDLEDKIFDAFIEIRIASVYSDSASGKTTIQTTISKLAVKKIENIVDEFAYNLSNSKPAE